METIIKLCFVLAAAFISAEATGSGPVGPITIYSINECADPVNMVDFQASLGEKDGKTVLDMSFDLGVDIADDSTVKINVIADRYDSDKDEWQKNAQKYEDQDFFNFFQKFIPDIWDHLREQISPKIEESTRIPAGEYSVEDFTADYEDFKFQLYYDKFNATVDIIQDGEKILCLNVEIECFPPKKS